ncbi:MAG: O-antigen ligase family protein [Deltaproteobacteria bacterium]|nr:O-antigen ligase family protein [Deltaproteobacteria bacterium]
MALDQANENSTDTFSDRSGSWFKSLLLTDKIFVGLLVVSIIASALILGGTPHYVAEIIQMATAALLLFAILQSLITAHQLALAVALRYLSIILLPLLAFILFALFEMVPLPDWLVKNLSPAAYDFYFSAEVPAKSISLERAASTDSLLWISVMLITFLWVIGLPRMDRTLKLWQPRQRRKVEERTLLVRASQIDPLVNLLCSSIIFAALLCSVISIVHWSLHLDSLYGIWKVEDMWPRGKTRLHWPFVNPNHLACFLTMAFILSAERFLRLLQLLSMSFGEDMRIDSVLQVMRNPQRLALPLMYGAVCCLLAITNLLTLSRAGIALMLLGTIILYWTYARFVSRAELSLETRKRSYSWRVIMLLLGVVVVASVLSQDQEKLLFDRLAYGLASGYDEFRMLLVQTAVGVIKDYWLVGVGLGCWPLVSMYYAPDKLAGLRLDYAHNDILQLLGEVGVIGLLLIAATMISLFARGYGLWKKEIIFTQRLEIIGLFIAGLVPLIHGLVDFPLYLPAISLTWTICLACLVRLLGERQG